MNKDKKGFTLAEAKKNISLATFRGRGIKGEGASKKAAFTLAEVLIVLLVLGIVAMIVVPPVMKKHQEMIGRMKIKKAMTIYDGAIARMTIENDLKTGTALKSWAEEGGNCDNPIMYFKALDRTSCTFKTADGVYWDITDIMNPIIATSKSELLKAQQNGTDGSKSFKLVTSFDTELGTFRVDDLGYEKKAAEESGDEEKLEELEKLYGFVANKVKLSNIDTSSVKYNPYPNECPTTISCFSVEAWYGPNPQCNSCTYTRPNGEKIVYGNDGNIIWKLENSQLTPSGKTIIRFKYDENGDYDNCDCYDYESEELIKEHCCNFVT